MKLYSKENCNGCAEALAFLTERGYTPEVLKLGKDYTIKELFDVAPKARSMPVLVDGDVVLYTLQDIKSAY